jgi:hypothetical protein
MDEEVLTTVEPQHYRMSAEPALVAAAVDEPTAVTVPPVGPVVPTPMSPRMQWLLQLFTRQQNPVWTRHTRSPAHYVGEVPQATPRGSRLESSRRKARRSLGLLSGRQWVRASKQIRRAVRAQDVAEVDHA